MEAAILVAVIAGTFSVFVVLLTKRLEGKSANTAILAEIRRLQHVVDRHKKWFAACSASDKARLPLVAFSTPVFDEAVKTIGQIDKDFVADVVAFYGYLKFINSMQQQRQTYIDLEKGEDFGGLYLGILNTLLSDYETKFTIALQKYCLA